MEPLELEEPRPDEVLVKIEAVGVCPTDIGARDGRLPVSFPIILGHEGAGRVVQVGKEIRTIAAGDAVLVTPDACGRCDRCRQGQTTYCDNLFAYTFAGVRPDGSPRARKGAVPVRAAFFGQSSFASYVLATERNLLRVPGDAPLQWLAGLVCGAQTGAGAVWNAMPVTVGTALAVFGVGTVGLSAVIAAKLAGADPIIAVDRVSSRLRLAQELGATYAIDLGRVSYPVDRIIRWTDGGCQVALDTTGSPQVIRLAVESLATRGVCGIVTGKGGEICLPPSALLDKGRMIRGIMGGDATGSLLLKKLVGLFSEGKFPIDRLVKHYPFAEINRAIAAMQAGEVIKPVLLFSA
ncbi:MAG: NAD(P)-dependent alcohol dehydrogenase [Firmicutes bacterium]|nr:NAD(P)-dependent alcohol dehydrogenase [Alicyclobacillaceae bacterium]MCL6497197.1 NAD(P)-dependent alcohol dehydrogenase [Bacillota bacterium]